MDVTQALDQLNEIRHHLGRSEIYRGYRSKTLATMGVLGMLGALFLQIGWSEATKVERVGFWVALASFNLALACWEILGDYGELKTEHQRRTTRRAVGQFIPTLCSGFLLTMAFVANEVNLDLLPGIWAVVFALGIFSSRPYLPRGVGWVGAYFLVAGALLLGFCDESLTSPWRMGGVFGGGHMLLAYVLYQNLERESK